MRLFPRSVLGSIGSVFSPKNGKDKEPGKDTSAPSIPAVGNDVPTPNIAGIVSDLPTPNIPGAAKEIPTPIPSASITETVTAHDLATFVSTIPSTKTLTQHEQTTISTMVPTTVIIVTTHTPLASPSSAHRTPTPLPVANPHLAPTAILSIVLSLMVVGLLSALIFLMIKYRRLSKSNAAAGSSRKRFADEFEWPQGVPVQKERDEGDGKGGVGRKDEWGPKQKEAWGVV